LPSPAMLVLSFLMDSTRLSLVVGFLNPQILSSLTHDRRLYGICLFRRACF
jgi:pilus assembly protein TadC